MPILRSKLNCKSESWQKNSNDMSELLSEMNSLLEKAAEGGGEEAVERLRLNHLYFLLGTILLSIDLFDEAQM